jgi:nucleotide-binding universal stress UspA family protein
MFYASLPSDQREQEDLRQRQAAATQIAQVVARALRAQKRQPDDVPDFDTYVRYGDPRGVIKAAVKNLDIDLLLLGTHAYAGVAHFFLGTVAGDVLRDVRCDVLVVPPRRPRGRSR